MTTPIKFMLNKSIAQILAEASNVLAGEVKNEGEGGGTKPAATHYVNDTNRNRFSKPVKVNTPTLKEKSADGESPYLSSAPMTQPTYVDLTEDEVYSRLYELFEDDARQRYADIIPLVISKIRSYNDALMLNDYYTSQVFQLMPAPLDVKVYFAQELLTAIRKYDEKGLIDTDFLERIAEQNSVALYNIAAPRY